VIDRPQSRGTSTGVNRRIAHRGAPVSRSRALLAPRRHVPKAVSTSGHPGSQTAVGIDPKLLQGRTRAARSSRFKHLIARGYAGRVDDHRRLAPLRSDRRTAEIEQELPSWISSSMDSTSASISATAGGCRRTASSTYGMDLGSSRTALVAKRKERPPIEGNVCHSVRGGEPPGWRLVDLNHADAGGSKSVTPSRRARPTCRQVSLRGWSSRTKGHWRMVTGPWPLFIGRLVRDCAKRDRRRVIGRGRARRREHRRFTQREP